jgi:hypothetical protein
MSDDVRRNHRNLTEKEREQAREQLEAEQAEFPLRQEERIKLLESIYRDTGESYSIRCDARRLIEVADIRPKDFPREFAEFMESRSYES